MNKEVYEGLIEKKAGLGQKAIDMASKHKKLIAGGALGAGALGTAYLASGDETKDKIRKGVNTAGKSIATAQINGTAQEILKNTGGVIGTGLAMAKGKPIGKALASGGLAGMAIGDIAGASTIPTYQLYKKHKKEFGEAPDAKSLAAVMGANVAPTAALWGGLYGLSKGKKIRNSIEKGLEAGAVQIGEGAKGLLSSMKKRNGSGLDQMIRSNGIAGDAVKSNERLKQVGKGLAAAGGAFLPLKGVEEVAAIPTYVATPENVISMKKRRLKQQSQQDQMEN